MAERTRINRRSRKTVAADIGRIILLLHAHKVCDDLCNVGVARLKWWRTIGVKFTSAAAAFATWDEAAIRAWLDWRDVDYDTDGGQKDSYKRWALQGLQSLEQNAAKLKLTLPGIRAIKAKINDFDTGYKDALIRAAVKAIPSARDIS